MKCSFCEQPLACKGCGKPFKARSGDTHVGVYQPDAEVLCPECEQVLVCKACGYVYGDVDSEEK